MNRTNFQKSQLGLELETLDTIALPLRNPYLTLKIA